MGESSEVGGGESGITTQIPVDVSCNPKESDDDRERTLI